MASLWAIVALDNLVVLFQLNVHAAHRKFRVLNWSTFHFVLTDEQSLRFLLVRTVLETDALAERKSESTV